MNRKEKEVADNDFKFVFESESADLLFLKHFEILSVLKGDLQPIMDFVENATF
jgi:hypothetical protein